MGWPLNRWSGNKGSTACWENRLWNRPSFPLLKAVIGGYLVTMQSCGSIWWITNLWSIHSDFLQTNETNNVNCTFHDGVDFFTNITSAVHHSRHLKLPKTTADGSLTHSSCLAATLCFVTWLRKQCVGSQTRMIIALSNVYLLFTSSIFETAIR